MEKAFNPYEHLSVMHDAAGNPIFENLEDNGIPVSKMGSDGKYHSVMVPKRYLSSSAYRLWFKSEYPFGTVEVEDLTQPAVFNGQIFVDSLEFKVKVSLWADQERKRLISSSYGIIRKDCKMSQAEQSFNPEGAENRFYNSFELAQSIALRNAMSNAGYIIDMNSSALKEADAQFVDAALLGEVLDIEPPTEEPKKEKKTAEASKKVKAETKEVSAAKETSSDDDVLMYLDAMETEEKAIDEKAEEQIKWDELEAKTNPSEIVFTVLEGAPAQYSRAAGKKLGELDMNTLRYFASKDLSGRVSEETIRGINALI